MFQAAPVAVLELPVAQTVLRSKLLSFSGRFRDVPSVSPVLKFPWETATQYVFLEPSLRFTESLLSENTLKKKWKIPGGGHDNLLQHSRLETLMDEEFLR